MRAGAAAWRRLAALVVAAAISGCAGVYNRATNEPITAATPELAPQPDVMREHSIVLAFSGGGVRASAFAYGVLTALQDVRTPRGDLLDDVVRIHSVSGGSLTAAYYGLYGREGLARFPGEVLHPGLEARIRQSMLDPGNLVRLFNGGLNAREEFGDVLDERVFRGATFADLDARAGEPEILIHATDLYHRTAFPFIPGFFSMLCSDLSHYKVADAVAASMAVPLVFSPVVVRSFPDACRPLPREYDGFVSPRQDAPRGLRALSQAAAAYRRSDRPVYVRLADGGLTDNFGVSTLVDARAGFGTPHAPLTAREAVVVRRLLVVVVDASRPPVGTWLESEGALGGLETALAAADAAVDSASRQAVDAAARMVREWEKSVIAFRCGLDPAEARRLGAPEIWQCWDVKFDLAHAGVESLAPATRQRLAAIPTRLALPREDIEDAIEAGREAIFALEEVRTYADERARDPGEVSRGARAAHEPWSTGDNRAPR